MSELSHLTAAFRLAHRASESDRFDLATRNVFREIAHEIWVAKGKPDDEPVACAACGATHGDVMDGAAFLNTNDPICCEVNI